jgi:hypothetical protein
MAKEEPKASTVTSATESASFISSWKWESWAVDSTYNDFFQETSDGNISIGPKSQKSWIEVFTTVLWYILPVVIVGVIAWSFHVYVQTGWGATAIKDNYTFLCPYLNYSVQWFDEEFKCQTIQNIDSAYGKKKSELEVSIVEKLNEYIPVKLIKNILVTSPERQFAIDTYKNKTHMNEIMAKFEEVRSESKSAAWDNIICNGLSITGEWNVTTQCSIYGKASGNDDENGKVGSARIEAIRFLSNLADTSKSQFILLNPPTSLSMEKLNDKAQDGFETRTTISIQVSYVPFNLSEKL